MVCSFTGKREKEKEKKRKKKKKKKKDRDRRYQRPLQSSPQLLSFMKGGELRVATSRHVTV
jgi:hypothetical protein